MLKQRVLTALVLLAVLLPTLAVKPVWPFAAFTIVGIGAAGWEWARLNGAGAAAVVLGLVLAGACAAALAAGWAEAAPPAAWWVATALWVVGGVAALRKGVKRWPAWPQPVRIALGLTLLFAAWLALVHAKSIGVNFILSVLALVWAADIAAYFGGRRFGRRKLAPTISPGKSWEGAWSGLVGAFALAALWLAIDRAAPVDSASVYSALTARLGVAGLAVAIAALTAMGVVGDLFESLVKRSAGAKDSSTLLPGHGGVLDRVDALLPVLPLALALVSL
jgi:phosphatidate cytidylyltransferase